MPPTAAELTAALSQDLPVVTQQEPEGALFWTQPACADVGNYQRADLQAPTGSVVPIAEPVSTYDAQEDKAALTPMPAHTYQPHVLSFDSQQQLRVPPIPPVVPTATATAALDALVQALQHSGGMGARSAVLGWARSYPSGAQAVSPQDVARILQSVPLSLDHVCVSLELARCMGRQQLTCAHIAAACEVSPFFKTEVAVAMAPYTGDPGNQQAVLRLLPSYDRDKVTQAFIVG